jgi:hypothetical protein
MEKARDVHASFDLFDEFMSTRGQSDLLFGSKVTAMIEAISDSTKLSKVSRSLQMITSAVHDIPQ